jgi:hypothetical protein
LFLKQVKVYRPKSSLSFVSELVVADVLECPTGLLIKDGAERHTLRCYASGRLIGYAGWGRPHHPGDDSPIVIPTDP